MIDVNYQRDIFIEIHFTNGRERGVLLHVSNEDVWVNVKCVQINYGGGVSGCVCVCACGVSHSASSNILGLGSTKTDNDVEV